MPTYVYETIPAEGGETEPVTFEYRQSIHDEPLSAHPDTGEPVRKVVAAAGILSGSSSSPSMPMPSGGGGGCCGGGSCGCAH